MICGRLVLIVGSVLLAFLCASCNNKQSETPQSTKTMSGVSATTTPTSKILSANSSDKMATQPSSTEIISAVQQLVYENRARIRIDSVKDIKIARDRKGQWWVSAVAIPVKSANTDNAIIFMVKDGKKWSLIDIGTGVVPDELPLPEEVRGKLAGP